MHALAQLCVRRPVFATMLILSLVVVGIFSYFGLGVDLFPKVDIPTVQVTISNPGASPEEIETEITKKVEDTVNTISMVDEVRSTSSEGQSLCVISFLLAKNGDVAAQEVQNKVNLIVPNLPPTAKQPVVLKFDPDAAPILQIAVSAPRSLRDVTLIADKEIKQKLENTKGVGEITILGGAKREIHVLVDPDKLRSYNLTVTDVFNALRAQNLELPGGNLNAGAKEFTVRTTGRVIDAPQFNQITVASRGGYIVKVSDIGYAEDSYEEPRSAARLDGVPSVTLVVAKQSGENTVATADEVNLRLQQISATLPRDVKAQVISDQSVFIKAAVDNIKKHLIEGSFFAAIIIFLFLANIRTTLIAAVAIPTSIISTFALMAAMGFTLNQITMLALTLMVGIVIDDAIIVLENVYRFIEEKNMPPFQAAIQGTKEIGPAVMATTLSLLAVFLPVGFMGGIVGRFMSSFGFTSSFAIAVSLLVSFTLTPMLCSRFIKPPAKLEAGQHSSQHSSKESFIFKFLDTHYTTMLKWSMAHRKSVLAFSGLVMLSIVPLFMLVGKNFLPTDDQSQFNVLIRTPEGSSLATTANTADRMAQDIRQMPGVAHTLMTAGGGADRSVNNAAIYVKLMDIDRRTVSQQQLMQRTRELTKKYPPEIHTGVELVSSVGGNQSNAEIQYFIQGPDLQKLAKYSDQLLAKMRTIPTLTDTDSTLRGGKPEVRLEIDRARAADLGVSVLDIENALNTLVAGQVASTFNAGEDQYDVVVRAQEQFRGSADGLAKMTVPSPRLGSVGLDTVVRIVPGTGPSSINRISRERQVTVTGNTLPGGSQAAILGQIAQFSKELGMDADYRSGLTGGSKELGRTGYYFVLAFSLTFIFMYIVLAAQFESFIHPITILMTLPLAIPFGILSLLIAGQSVNIFSGLGLLLLFGIVKKNAILQIDHTNGLREQGMNRYDAIIQANRDRLRPILMTTIALVAGMAPLVISHGTGSATNRSIGVLVVGGQSLCLLLTLLAVPVFYSLFEDLGDWLIRSRDRQGALLRRVRGRFGKAAAVAALGGSLFGQAQPAAVMSQPVKEVEIKPRVGILAQTTIRLPEAIERVLANDPDLQISRIQLEEAGYLIRGAQGYYDPVAGLKAYRTRAVTPVASIIGGSASGKLTQQEWNGAPGISGNSPWGGTYAATFTNSRQQTDSTFVTLNPQYPSSVTLNLTQPLWRGLRFDDNRHRLLVARKNQALSGEQMRQRVIEVVTQAVQAYWELDYASQNLGVQTEAVKLAERQYESNQRQAEQGILAPVDVVAAQTQVATFQQNLFAAQQALTQAENNLKALMLPDRSDLMWSAALIPETQLDTNVTPPTLQEAVKSALASRPELAEAALAIDVNGLDTRLAREAAKPRVDAFANLTAAGLAGPVAPSGPNPFAAFLPGGFGAVPVLLVGSYGQSISNLVSGTFPSAQVGVQVSLPIRNRTADSMAAVSAAEGRRLRLVQNQIGMAIEADVRNSLQAVDSTQARLAASALARGSAEEQYASEQRQFQAGTSSVFLVLQRQTDLIAARGREVRAHADFAEALANLDRATARTIEARGISLKP
ncbi:MAG TPA: efflux RND transporter permease subunit [Candidatus Acidoferrales bacterium]|nr:efflux RND transporter permease subunit [Candidatus Acidoferrales bacterium]